MASTKYDILKYLPTHARDILQEFILHFVPNYKLRCIDCIDDMNYHNGTNEFKIIITLESKW